MISSVWERTIDWYSRELKVDVTKACCVSENLRSGREKARYDPCLPNINIPRTVLKGSSHLHAPNYCRRYRPAARHREPGTRRRAISGSAALIVDASAAMTDANPQELGLLPKLVIVLGILLIAAAVVIAADAIWYGMIMAVIERIWGSMFERSRGPLSFRFILQPTMAAIVAIRDGLKDARAGRSPYFRTVAGNSRERVGRLREGLIATARIILLGLTMDAIYQFLVFKTFYPAEAVIVALLLCFVPYLVIRGPVTRIVRWQRGALPGDIQ
jgi:hypothetical protein